MSRETALSLARPTDDPGRSRAALTDRIVRALPGPSIAWMLVWACVWFLRPLALVTVLGLTGEPARAGDVRSVVASQVILAYVTLVVLWGTSVLLAGLHRAEPGLVELTPLDPDAGTFSHLTDRAGPIALAVAVVVLATPGTWLQYGPAVAAVDVPLLSLGVLPITTFIWTYLATLAGLNCLGRARLALDRFPQDRSLGLAPVGRVALNGFWLVLITAVPTLLIAGTDLTTFVLSICIVAGIVAVFVLSMIRVHLQMRDAKDRSISQARDLVAAAYAPVRADPSIETLTARAGALGAAQALLARAEQTLEWPIDERTIALMTVIVTGVVTSLAVRLVFLAANL